MVTIHARERYDNYGIRYLTYRVNRKRITEIQFPVDTLSLKPIYRCIIGGCCFDYNSMQDAIKNTERYLSRIYFGGIEIKYHD